MEKAYDPKGLIEEAKAEGLPLLEDSAEALCKAVFRWLNKSADISENKYDDFAKMIYPHAEGLALKQLDKIDGKVGA
jgi:hypothetical protein